MPSMDTSSADSRLQALRAKHAILAKKIEEAQNRYGTGDYSLSRLKKQKLIIKEEIEGVRDNSTRRRSAI